VIAKDLYSTWKDGGKKLKKIISVLRSEKASMEEERRNAAAADVVVQSHTDGCSDSEPGTGAAEEDAPEARGLSTPENIEAHKQKSKKKTKKCRRHALP
jgi:hypothetical protein